MPAISSVGTQASSYHKEISKTQSISLLEQNTEEIGLNRLFSCSEAKKNETIYPSQIVRLSIDEFYKLIPSLDEKIKVKNDIGVRFNIKSLNKDNPDMVIFLPRFQIKYKNAIYYCSSPFQLLDEKYQVVFSLVEIDDQVYPRLFYLSHSQGTWRTPNSLNKQWSSQGYKLLHLGKGHFESDTNLPIAVNLALHSLLNKEGVNTFDKSSWNNFAAFNFMKKQLFEILPGDNALSKSYVSLVCPVLISEINVTKDSGLETQPVKDVTGAVRQFVPPPESIHMINEMSFPNFRELVFEGQQSFELYGDMTLRIFRSFDRSIDYLFGEEKNGRAFLMSAENNTDTNLIEKHGLLEHPINLNHLDTPLFDYYFQTAKKYFVSESNKDIPYPYSKVYSSQWNYIREMEMIRQYYLSRNKEIPKNLTDKPDEVTQLENPHKTVSNLSDVEDCDEHYDHQLTAPDPENDFELINESSNCISTVYEGSVYDD